MNFHAPSRLLPAVALIATLAACAYQRPEEVTAQMARTEAVLQQAQQSGAQVEALPELQRARDKFADATKAFKRRSEEGDREAMALAEQAQADAQFAAAKAQAARQQRAAGEVEQGVRTLEAETAARPGNASEGELP